MNIIKPEGEATTAQATVEGRYVKISHAGDEITLLAMARPGNYSEVIYWTGVEFDLLPSEPPVMAAVLASHAGQLSLTLFALPEPQADQLQQAEQAAE